jgi:twitching motility protein PilT
MSDTDMTLEELFSPIRYLDNPRLTEAELQDLLSTNPRAFFDAICMLAVEENSSDIFWKAGSPPCFRLAGKVVQLDMQPLTGEQIEEIFFYGLMTERQREKFRERPELDTAFEIPNTIRFRVNVYKQRGAMAAVMRLIPLDIFTLEELTLPKVLATLVVHKQGMVLVTGPTGCGKSTTLAALLDLINMNRRVNIISIEDPIEYVHRDKLAIMSQREVGVDTNNFIDPLRAVVREAPDVILIGEMRDVETMTVAMTAAETGHLVFSTVHTNSSSETIERIVNMFPPHEKPQICLRLSMTLLGIVSQKLVPTVDGKSRVPAMEIMINTPTVSKLIEEGRAGQVPAAVAEGGYWGMQTMNQSLLTHFKEGSISEEMAVAYAGNPTEMRQMIRRLSQANVASSAVTA